MNDSGDQNNKICILFVLSKDSLPINLAPQNWLNSIDQLIRISILVER